MAQTKDQQIAILKKRLAKAVDINSRFDHRVDDVEKLNRELQSELDSCSNVNDRLNASLKKEVAKISKLKDVARFYRAQRDRVDAYLSSMIDAAELKERPLLGRGAQDEIRSATQAIPEPPPLPYWRRPRVQEPRDGGLHEDGRAFALYRDKEPEKDWETF